MKVPEIALLFNTFVQFNSCLCLYTEHKMAVGDITEDEKEWKLQFHEWRTKYIVDWKRQYDTFMRSQARNKDQCH